jgi:hypothetical protein
VIPSSFTRSALVAHASKRINDYVGDYDQCVKLTLQAAHGGGDRADRIGG